MHLGHGIALSLGSVYQDLFIRLAAEGHRKAHRERWEQVLKDLHFDVSHWCVCVFWLYYRNILIHWEHAFLLIF